MGTGLDSFTNPQNIGALYPFVGFEVPLVIAGVVLWLAWQVRQTKIENREYQRAMELYERVGLRRALEQGGTEWLPDEHRLRADDPATEHGAEHGAERGTGHGTGHGTEHSAEETLPRSPRSPA